MEFVDIYNDERVLTGERLPRNTKLPAGKYTLYVLALIQNKDGYLITRRTLDKKWAAGAWEIPGGGVMAGESSEEAIRREVKEETGLDIQDHALLYSYKNIDLERGDNYFTDIYLCPLDFTLNDVHVQEREVLDVRCASFGDITKLAKTHGFLHYERLCEALKKK